MWRGDESVASVFGLGKMRPLFLALARLTRAGSRHLRGRSGTSIQITHPWFGPTANAAGGAGRHSRMSIAAGFVAVSLAAVGVSIQPAAATGLPDASAAAPTVVAALAGEVVAPIVAQISLSDQTMTVYLNAEPRYTFTVSTGRDGYRTPTGTWRAQWLSPHHRSSKYNNAPMPWSVFFYKGYAVHGTTEEDSLGQPASHGCIRLTTAEAKIFFDLVQQHGMPNTVISVVN